MVRKRQHLGTLVSLVPGSLHLPQPPGSPDPDMHAFLSNTQHIDEHNRPAQEYPQSHEKAASGASRIAVCLRRWA